MNQLESMKTVQLRLTSNFILTNSTTGIVNQATTESKPQTVHSSAQLSQHLHIKSLKTLLLQRRNQIFDRRPIVHIKRFGKHLDAISTFFLALLGDLAEGILTTSEEDNIASSPGKENSSSSSNTTGRTGHDGCMAALELGLVVFVLMGLPVLPWRLWNVK